MQKTPYADSEFYNYKKFYSIITMVVVESKYKFIWLNIGINGSASVAQTWNNNQLKLGISIDRFNLPQPEPFPGDSTDIPFFLIGDYAFAIDKFLIKQYALTHEKRILNYNRLCLTRSVVENTSECSQPL